MAIDVCINPIKSLEDLPDQRWECFGKRNTCAHDQFNHFPARLRGSGSFDEKNARTDSAGKHGFIVDVALDPRHQMLHILGRGHLRWPFEILRVLPEKFEPDGGKKSLGSVLCATMQGTRDHTRRLLSSRGMNAASRTP